MPDKTVWVIGDSPGGKKANPAVNPRKEKNPALAFSLSLLVWGCGQIYNGQRILGFLFMLLMADFYAVLGLAVFYFTFIPSSLPLVSITSSQVLGAWWVVYLSGLVLWSFNAIHAYHKSMQTQAGSFQGVNSRLFPPFFSLLIPGWGQFLNGQPKKGSFFLLVFFGGHFVVSTFLLMQFLWPVLNFSSDRLLLEKAVAAAAFLFPLVFLLWGLGIYDAARVCMDPVKKEPMRKRIEYAVNRMRLKGWKRGLAPRAKLTFVLGLFLVLSLAIGYSYFPQKDYTGLLKSLRLRLSNEKMVLLPSIIDHFLQIFGDPPRR